MVIAIQLKVFVENYSHTSDWLGSDFYILCIGWGKPFTATEVHFLNNPFFKARHATPYTSNGVILLSFRNETLKKKITILNFFIRIRKQLTVFCMLNFELKKQPKKYFHISYSLWRYWNQRYCAALWKRVNTARRNKPAWSS